MDVDVQGAKTFKKKFPQALTVFILPPSIDSLRHRVIERDGGVPRDIEIRMRNAQQEMAQAGDFDLKVVNADFDKAYGEFRKMIEESLEIK
jgi:guanylate kinase